MADAPTTPTTTGDEPQAAPLSGRLNFRVRPETEQRLRAAAGALDMSLTDFVVTAGMNAADDVLATTTVVPAQFFERLIAALDQPWPRFDPTPGDSNLRRVSQFADKIVRQE
jgi:uncharacterized protein (DUF1778 family)